MNPLVIVNTNFSVVLCVQFSLSLSLSLLSNICFVFVYEFWNIFR